MALGGEQWAVQNPMINYAQDVGWQYISRDDALRLRGGEIGLILRETFIDQMVRLNAGFMDNLLAEELIKRLERVQPNIEGNLMAWEYLKGLRAVFVPNKKRERDVTFIDTDNINRNTFQVTDEFQFTNGSKTIRQDVVFLINGMPLLFAETKAAHKVEGIAEALEQVRRYHNQCPELMAILQVYSLTHIIHYYYSATWNASRKYLYNWKEDVQGDYETLVKAFLDKDRVVRVLTDFILFTRKDGVLRKVVMRPHQMRAVDRLIDRAMDKEKKRGLVWHTQGSGKTYTMIITAQKIIENPIFQNPTVIMLVDRNELETQLFNNLSSVGIENVEVAYSKRNLKDLLSSDRRGLIVSMIHKFDDIPANINTRSNIFVLVDEAHRTTGGDLGNYLMSALPNATYMGFTGTPIDRSEHGKGTFITFGKDDPERYIDKYGIAESIADGTTVPLHYTLAPNELLVDRETLDREFLELKETEGISDIEEVNKILERAVNLRNMLKNSDRVENVAKYVADHYRDYIEPMGYKAFLVGVDREACALYKKELDKHLPPEYSAVVYSSSQNDEPPITDYHLSETEEKRIRKAFINVDELPKILIVTEKLLTGFDAPILYCMYLDKPMRDHVLLQAIARVNRPYEDDSRQKPCGFILDFVGVFSNLKKALAFDSQDIEGVIQDIELLKAEFSRMIGYAKENYLSIIEGRTQDKAVEAVLQYFMDEEVRHTFYNFFNKVSEIYDILSPDAFLGQYIGDMNNLAMMYRIVRGGYEPAIMLDREFSKKVAKLVQEQTKSSKIKDTLDIYEINEDTMRRIEDSKVSDIEKVFNLIKSIEKTVTDNAPVELYLISIGEKAERIAEMFKNRQMDTLDTLEEAMRIVDEINAARKERAERDVTDEVFSMYWVMKNDNVNDPEDRANYMGGVIDKYPHWRHSEKHEMEVKRELTKTLIQSGMNSVSAVTELTKKIMRVIKGVVRP